MRKFDSILAIYPSNSTFPSVHLWLYPTLSWSLICLFTAIYWLGGLGISTLRNLNDIRPGYSVPIGLSIYAGYILRAVILALNVGLSL